MPYDHVLGIEPVHGALRFRVPPPYHTVDVETAGTLMGTGLGPDDRDALIKQIMSASARARGLGTSKNDVTGRVDVLRRNGESPRDWLARLDMAGRMLEASAAGLPRPHARHRGSLGDPRGSRGRGRSPRSGRARPPSLAEARDATAHRRGRRRRPRRDDEPPAPHRHPRRRRQREPGARHLDAQERNRRDPTRAARCTTATRRCTKRTPRLRLLGAPLLQRAHAHAAVAARRPRSRRTPRAPRRSS